MLSTSAASIIPKTLFLFLLGAAICVAAWYMQDSMLFNSDNDIILHETVKFLAGGSYVNNFFETTPPMIIYLNILPVLFSQWFSISLMLSFKIYVFALVLFTLTLCWNLAKSIFQPHDCVLKNIFFMAFLAITLIVPIYELGQREDLYAILSMPYIFAVTLRSTNKSISPSFASLIGFIAALGFAIKPFFIVTPIIVEFYLAIHKKSLRVWLRPETLTLIVVTLAYSLIALVLHADYFHIVIPYALRLYYSGRALDWSTIIFYPINIFAYISIIFYLILYQHLGAYKNFATILCLAFISFVLVFILQRVVYYYHAVPMLCLGLLLDIFLLSRVSARFLNNSPGWIILLTLLLMIFLYLKASIFSITLVFMPEFFWLYFSAIFLILYCLILNKKNPLQILASLAVVMGLAFWFSYTIKYSAPAFSLLANYRFTETVILLVVLFFLSIRKTLFNSLSVITLSVFTLVIFSYPAFIVYALYKSNLFYRDNTVPLITFAKDHMQHHTVYALGSNSRYIFPIIDYAGGTVVSRFPFLWMMSGLIKNSHLALADAGYSAYLRDKNFLLDMVNADINNYKPDFILVDVSPEKANVEQPFEYLTYFADNKKFLHTLASYHYLTTLHGKKEIGHATYNLAVYQRAAPNHL